ncbi:MAG: S8 family serine peptidase, partial [Eggerthellaceae bacterium]|nr:S8 family serine peptidase [Eggerthellaceae bacterium]
MNKRRNRSWIAGAIAAACALVLVCVVALPKGAQPESPSTQGGQQVEINLPSNETASQTADSSAETQQNSAEADQDDPYGGMEYEPGVVLVTLPAGVSPSDALATIVEETGLEGVGFADESDASAHAVTAAETPLRVELSVPADMPMSQAVDLISASSAVDAAQPNFVYYLNDADAADSTDPASAETQARSTLIAQNFIVQDLVTQAVSVNDAADQWMLPSIFAYNDTAGVGNAWDVVRSDQNSSNRVTVAVIDEGFQANHPDLVGNVVETYNATDKSADVSEVSGQGGHGTHVAGIVAATANNNQGVAGVSYNARLLLIKGMNSKGGFSTSDLAHAMDYTRSKKSAYNIRVINMSIGSKFEYDDNGNPLPAPANWPGSMTKQGDKVLIEAIDNAVNAGIVVVCSAGNAESSKGWNPPYIDYPADYQNVISVMNLTHTGNDPHNVSLASNSNYNVNSVNVNSMNTGKNICAPGTSIRGTYPTSTYQYKSGTSMAAPCVSGVLALVFTKQPNLTVAEATSLLYSTATDIGDPGWDRRTGYGEVNAYRAVTEAANAVVKTDISEATITFPTCTYNGSTQKATPTVKVGAVTLEAGTDYTLSYPDSDYASIGTKSVIVKSTGTRTTGNVTKTYSIARAPMSSCTVSLGATSLAYTGSAQTPAVTVTRGSTTLRNGTDYTLAYTNNKSIGTATVTVTGQGNYTGIQTKTFTIYDPPCTVQYQTHVQTYGWQSLVKDGAMSGTSGQSKRLEGIKITLSGTKYTGGITYRTHVQTYGWQGWKYNGELSGTSGQSKRLEAIQIKLYGEMASHYDVYYRVHCQHIGWMNWAKNGES